MFDVIAFDADDTLWHNETLYSATQERFQALLSRYELGEGARERLYETEVRNLQYYGYGIKSFTLSMIETAIELTGGAITGSDLQQIIEMAKEMLRSPVQLLDHVAEVIATLSASHTLMLITKGDLFDQETKIARSGLAPHFAHVEIVRDKTEEVYRAILDRHQISPQRFLMVGNSQRSDILPVVALGAHAVYIPYAITWEHERVAPQGDASVGYVELEHIGLLPGYVEGGVVSADSSV